MAVEEAFKNLKGDLAIRPVFHQLEGRIEAHLFTAFVAYCRHALARRLHALAPGLTSRSVLEKFAAMFARETEAGTARPIATENHRCICTAAVVPTFGVWLQHTQLFRFPKVLESAKLG